MIDATSTLVDVAYAVCTRLAAARITAVLTGGSAATFWAPAALSSRDLDFVLTVYAPGGEAALASLGYQRHLDYYVHTENPLPLEFPPGPLGIGDDLVTRWHTARRGAQVLHVLTATDACRDRLASYLFWDDFAGLEQALAVARAERRRVDLAAVEAWCKRQRALDKFILFRDRLRARPPRSPAGGGGRSRTRARDAAAGSAGRTRRP